MTAYNIKKSHRVFLFGKGDSRISLENFKNKMIKLNEYFIIGDEYQNNFYTVGNITSNDPVSYTHLDVYKRQRCDRISISK